jgi:hypothetical protein
MDDAVGENRCITKAEVTEALLVRQCTFAVCAAVNLDLMDNSERTGRGN